MDGVRKLIHEFLESEEIRDAKIDGFFLKNAINANDLNGLDVWAKKREFFSDLRELLQGSKYSGAQSKMEEILQYSNFIVSDVKAVRPPSKHRYATVGRWQEPAIWRKHGGRFETAFPSGVI